MLDPAVRSPSRTPAIAVEVDVVPALVAGGVGQSGQRRRGLGRADHRKTRIVADVVRPGGGFGEQGGGIAEQAWSSPAGMVRVAGQVGGDRLAGGGDGCCQAMTATRRWPAAFQAWAGGRRAGKSRAGGNRRMAFYARAIIVAYVPTAPQFLAYNAYGRRPASMSPCLPANLADGLLSRVEAVAKPAVQDLVWQPARQPRRFLPLPPARQALAVDEMQPWSPSIAWKRAPMRCIPWSIRRFPLPGGGQQVRGHGQWACAVSLRQQSELTAAAAAIRWLQLAARTGGWHSYRAAYRDDWQRIGVAIGNIVPPPMGLRVNVSRR